MARKLIDISVPLQNDVPADPPGMVRRSNMSIINKVCREILRFFPGLKGEDLPDGQGWAVESACSSDDA